jgi:hypothetical protein
VGIYLHGYDSLWLAASLLGQQEQNRLVGALFNGSRLKRIDLQFNKGLAGAPAEAVEGASRPRPIRPWWTLLPLRSLPTAGRLLIPDAGSYVSESNYFNRFWQAAFWGKNYARLRAIKDKYDPNGLFFVHQGVGSEDGAPTDLLGLACAYAKLRPTFSPTEFRWRMQVAG